MPERSEAPNYNSRGFIAAAESYGTAAFVVLNGPRLPHRAPIGMLAAHCMELSLKAVLLWNGATDKDLRKYGHNLRRLLEASGLDWSDLDEDSLDFYDDAAKEHAFRYIDMDQYFLLGDGERSLLMCEQIFHRCLQRVLPGAQRSLRRKA
ncbi:hypothetical protein [Methylobacterium radiotolerans]|uniref:HEPN domain-containing protein n=1 Tax=Methylobacterium radiotolerans (strain ATCC 27329 / DSM 1819 / JCM 2831 / NBRC 15690 / NCIMB 10815 / 0-1) TaxID=426355 RepID=B1MAC2_METRJ|nr:hypothetical protein [Methylobacterium radiotolerans]ACB28447.1 hypothetical protein Mrad2831_6535 [Methylobacterium radiotolerans JCM 2831]GEN01720.1 hypothetical protein MRA01_62590 [Methylobacterium radiotolerans]